MVRPGAGKLFAIVADHSKPPSALDIVSSLGRAPVRLALAPWRRLRSAAGDLRDQAPDIVALRWPGDVISGVGGRGRLWGSGSGDEDDVDVLLDVPRLKVGKLELEVEDLVARVSLQAELADLVEISVGADVRLGRVALDMEGVEAQALLKVRLDPVAAILERALQTIDENPQILERTLAAALDAVDEVGYTAQQVTGGIGETARRAAQPAGGGGSGPAATDAARRLAGDRDIDLGDLSGTGSGGKITVGDVRSAAGS